MTNSIEDVCEQAQVILLVGSNPEEAHPVMGMRIRQAVERGAKLIVVDPRDIGLASKADIHLKLRPGTNVAFANGMAMPLLPRGLPIRNSSKIVLRVSRNSQPWLPTIRPKRWRRFAVSMRMTLFRLQRCMRRPIVRPLFIAWAWRSIPRAPKALCPCLTWPWSAANSANPVVVSTLCAARTTFRAPCDHGCRTGRFHGLSEGC